MERKLATIRKISEIWQIPDADSIELAVIDGWKVVVKKGEYFEGSPVVFCEIDSWIPHELAPFLSRGNEPREYNGVKGERLKSIKLRGQLSQGLILPMSVLANGKNNPGLWDAGHGYDVTEHLGIQKWEPPIETHLQGMAKGNFPSFIQKTDQERCQNLRTKIFGEYSSNYESCYEVTIKMDGSSMTVFHYDQDEDIVGVCSRNIRLKIDQQNNTFVDVAKSMGLLRALKTLGKNIAVQGELMGPGIQGNREKFSNHHFYVFDIFDIDNQKYFDPETRYVIFDQLCLHGADIKHVPIIDDGFYFYQKGISSIDDLLELSDGPSLNHSIREGLVFKAYGDGFSFKVINNRYLLGEK